MMLLHESIASAERQAVAIGGSFIVVGAGNSRS